MFKKLLFAVFLIVSFCAAEAQYVLEDFAPKVQAIPQTYKHLIQANGKVLLAGNYTFSGSEDSRHIVRLNLDGSVDQSFQLSDSIPNLFVLDMIEGHNEDIAIIINTDLFSSYILASDGTLKTEIANPEGFGRILDIRKYRDGYVTIFESGWPNRSVYRLDSLGNINENFTPFAFEGGVSDLMIDEQDRITLLGDNFSQITYNDVISRVYRLDSLGNVDESLGSIHLRGSNLNLWPVPDNKFIVSGNLDSLDFEPLNDKVIMVDDSWTLDPTFSASSLVNVFSNGSIGVAQYIDDNNIIVQGTNVNFDGGTIRAIKIDGSINQDFTPIDVDFPFRSQLSYGGGFIYYNESNSFVIEGEHHPILKFDTSGNLDLEYSSKAELLTIGIVNYSIVDSEGSIVLAGRFSRVDNVIANSLAKIDADNTLDVSFSTNHGLQPNSNITKIEETASNSLLIGGYLSFSDESEQAMIAKFNQDGTLDNTFGRYVTSSSSGSVLNDFEQLGDGRIVIAGDFSAEFAMLDASGNYLENFNINSDSTRLISGENISIYNDEIVISGFRFSTTGSSDGQRGFLWFVDENGDFIPERNSTSSLMIHPRDSKIIDGKILLGGSQWSFGNTTPNPVLQIDIESGQIDDTSIATFGFNGPRFNRRLMALNDSTLIVAGSFEKINSSDAFSFAGISYSGRVYDRMVFDFSENNQNNFVSHMTKLNDSTLIVSGRFDQVNDMNASGLIKLSLTNFPTSVEIQDTYEVKEDSSFFLADLVSIKDLDDEVSLNPLENENLFVDSDGFAVLKENFNGTIELGIAYEINNEVIDTVYTTLNILPVNDPPLIISQISVKSAEPGTEFTIELGDLEIIDPDEGDEISIELTEGENYSIQGTDVIQLDEIFEGSVFVNLRVTDGVLFSDDFTYELTSEFILSIVQSSLRVYPNPAADYLQISGITSPDLKVVVYDQSGVELGKFNFSNAENQESIIDISSFDRGLLLMAIIQNGNVEWHKVIKN